MGNFVRSIRRIIRGRFPQVANAYIAARHYLRLRRYRRKGMKGVFTEIYLKRMWGRWESFSGSGSTLEQTQEIRTAIPALVTELGIETLLDIPCGDFYWMKEVKLGVTNYIGADIVDALIQQNIEKFGGEGRQFRKLDITNDPLPEVGLIFCRDCLVHLSFGHIFEALGNIKRSNSTYLLTTTYPECKENLDIVTGAWRPINLQLPPFGLPPPIRMINEKGTIGEGMWRDKSLALWKIADIPVSGFGMGAAGQAQG